jgi:HEAT repeat protein
VSRRWLVTAAVLAAVAVAAAVASTSGLRPGWAYSSLAVVVGAGALTATVADRLAARRRPLLASPAVRTVLDAQHGPGGLRRYRFFDEHVPAARDIYVQQHAEAAGGDLGASAVLTVAEVLARNHCALVLAGAGGGKSTLVSQVAERAAVWWLTATRTHRPREAPFGPVVPVAVAAAALVDDNLPAALASGCQAMLGARVPPSTFAGPPHPGTRWLVLADGVDEVMDPQSRSRVLWNLAQWAGEPDRPYRFLITSRPLPRTELAGLRARGAAEFRLRPFDVDDLGTFAHRWFAARRPDEPEPVRAALAEDYVQRVAGAPWSPLMRVPLLATIAAIVFEDPDTGPLAGRADLYERFVQHLMYSRGGGARLLAELYTRGRDGRRLAEWLDRHLRDVVEAVADERLRPGGRAAGIRELAVQVFADRSPLEPASVVRDWNRWVLALLTATGLFDNRGSDLEFVHPSICDYLAAGPRGEALKPEDWLSEVRDPGRRGLALLALARSRQPPDPLVDRLVGTDPADLVVAGEVLADGVVVTTPLRDRIVEAMVAGLVAERDTATDCLRVLVELSGDPAVMARLERLAEDRTSPPWVRAVVADAIRTVSPDSGNRLLRTVALDDRLSDGVRRWAALRLYRGVDGIVVDTAAVGPDEYDSVLARAALRSTARDEAVAPQGRFQDAEALARLGDVEGYRVLGTLAVDGRVPVETRLHAVGALVAYAAGTEPDHLRAVAGDVQVDPVVRRTAAAALAGRGDGAGLAVLHELAADPDVDAEHRWFAVTTLAELGDPQAKEGWLAMTGDARLDPALRVLAAVRAHRWDRAGTEEVLRSLTASRYPDLAIRLPAARALASAGDAVGLQTLRELAADDDPMTRYRAARDLAEVGSLADLRWLAADDGYDQDVRGRAVERLALRGDVEGLVAPLADRTLEPSIRLGAAGLLARRGVPAAQATLWDLAGDDLADTGVRRLAAQVLVSIGEKGARRILHDLAEDASLDPYVREAADAAALVTVASDTSTGLNQRAQAALQLAAVQGDPYDAVRILQELAAEDELDASVRAQVEETVAAYDSPSDAWGFDDPYQLLANAIAALTRHRDPSALHRLVRATDLEPDLRLAAAEALARHGDPEGEAMLQALATDPRVDPDLRRQAADLLG